jgi:hypothetical protein
MGFMSAFLDTFLESSANLDGSAFVVAFSWTAGSVGTAALGSASSVFLASHGSLAALGACSLGAGHFSTASLEASYVFLAGV